LISYDELFKEVGGSADWVYETAVPAFRSFDVSRDVDLIEEVLRIYGYTRVEPRRPLLPAEAGEPRDLQRRVRNFLTDRGLNEVVTFPWIEDEIKDLFGLDSYWEIVNPLNSEQRHLRTSLVPSLVKVLKHNRSNFVPDFAAFELGRVYFPDREESRVGLLAVGKMRRHFLAQEDWSFFTFKGLVEGLLTRFGIENFEVRPKELPFLHPFLGAAVWVDGTEVGYFGRLHPKVAEELELGEPPFVAEFNLDLLTELYRRPSFGGLSKFPPVKRDFAFVFPKEGSVARLLAAAEEAFGDLLEELFVFDVYEGERLGPNEVSVALRVVLRHPERSLSDEEVNRLAERFVKLAGERGYRLRG